MTLPLGIQNMQRRFVHIECYCPIISLVSMSLNTLAPLYNGFTTLLLLKRLQTNGQRVVVHHMLHFKMVDAWPMKAPTAHGGFVMYF